MTVVSALKTNYNSIHDNTTTQSQTTPRARFLFSVRLREQPPSPAFPHLEKLQMGEGAGLRWYIDDKGVVSSEFTLTLAQQGPPGQAHGGLSAAVLDEVTLRLRASRLLRTGAEIGAAGAARSRARRAVRGGIGLSHPSTTLPIVAPLRRRWTRRQNNQTGRE